MMDKEIMPNMKGVKGVPKWVLVFLALLVGPAIWLQNPEQTDTSKIKWRLDGGLETYVLLPFTPMEGNTLPSPFVSYHRTNEFNLNMGFLRAEVGQNQWRVRMAGMFGTYAIANLSSEPEGIRWLYEANLGIKLSRKKNLWLEAGILPSHIGFETPFGLDNHNLSRSLVADNSPYYMAGAQVSYQSPSEKWLIRGILMNGWQQVFRPRAELPAIGHQVVWSPNEKFSLLSSSFVGKIARDSSQHWRLYHHAFVRYQWHARWEGLGGFDIGSQSSAQGWNIWWSPVLQLRFKAHSRVHLAGRLEGYADPHQQIIRMEQVPGWKVWGGSMNLDVQFLKYVKWRLEARYLFHQNGEPLSPSISSSSLGWVATSLGVRF